jgi:hypothetical protein
VVAGKYYSAIVRAVQDLEGVITAEDSTMSAGVLPTLDVPGAPTSVVVSSVTSGGAIVSWVAGVCTDSYNCQIIQSANSDMSSPSYPTQTPDNVTSVNSGDSFAFTAVANYYYAAQVTAYNTIGNAPSSVSTGVQYITAPNAPTSVAVVSISPTEIVISWSPPSGTAPLDSYNGAIFESTTSGGITAGTGTQITTKTGITSSETFSITPVSGRYYGAVITAVNTAGSTNSVIANITPALYIAPPGAPTSIIRSALSGTGMTVAWTAPVGGGAVDSYTCQIYSSTASDMQTSRNLVSPQTPSNSTSVPESGVTLEQAFLFTATDGLYYGAIVTAVNVAGSTASSTTSNFTGSLYTAPPAAPNAPTSVVVVSISPTAIVISWSAPSGGGAVASYNGEIFESTTSGGITGGTGTSVASATGINSGHSFAITAVSARYYGAIITAVNVTSTTDSVIANITPGLYTPPSEAPGAPTSIIRSALSGTGMTVAWTAPVGGGAVASYTCQIYQSTASDMQTSRTLVSPQTPSNSTAVPESGVTLEQAFLFTATDGYYYGAIVTATNEIGSTASSTTSNFTGSLYTAGALCFKEDTKILCKINNTEQYIPIQALRNGDLVKTSLNGFKSIYMIGWKEINHIISEKRTPNQLYLCSKANFPEATEDLIVTGAHSILVGALTDIQREEIAEVLGKLYITGDKYRLPACVDERTTIYEKEGLCNIYHFALENDNYYMNYGIYANGILVETSSQRYIKEISTMTIIQ